MEAKIPRLVEELTALCKDGAIESLNTRREVTTALYKLIHELETPMESLFRILIIQPVLYMAVRVAIDLDLFTAMSANDGSPKTSSELAQTVEANPVLLGRLLRQMASMDFIRETAAETFELTHVSRSLLAPTHRDGFPFCHDILIPTFGATRQFLSETKYANPRNIMDTPFQLGHSTKKPWFGFLAAHPERDQQFNNFMGMYARDRPRWLDPGHFPIRRILGDEAQITEEHPVLMVDVGGGKGQDITTFHERYPDLKGRLILQDIPSVIKQAGTFVAPLESMVYDFYTPQPIHNARAYYFHSVLHGLPDDKCLAVLSNITSAMKPGYSKLLINEIVIPNEKAHCISTSMDLLMMSVVAAEERTEANWHRILKVVGLKIVKIWHFEINTESVIEAELA